MHIVLVYPEIPQNTGNVARTCAATGAHLHLIKPLGFSLEDKYLKRAGLDYWHMMKMTLHDSLEAFFACYPHGNFYFATTKAPHDYTQVEYAPDDFLVFGCETKGLPESLLAAKYQCCVRIPMIQEARSLNLSNSVAVVLYEALRQQGFPDLLGYGHLHGTADETQWKDYIG